MIFLWMFVGAVFGGWLSWIVLDESVGALGMTFGIVCGLLFGRLARLGKRIGELEAQIKMLVSAPATQRAEVPDVAVTPSLPVETAAMQSATAPAHPVFAPVAATAAMADRGATTIDLRTLAAATETRPASATTSPSPAPPRADPPALAWLKRWLTEGNPLVKAGIVVVFFGVAYLFKYAADAGGLSVPVEFRFLAVAAAALAALAFAWRKRESQRPFALSLQGGAIGVLILTIFAAYRLYALLPPTLTFALLVTVVAGAGLLAVLQDSAALAVLAIVGGFLAPILASTDSGNHVALFSYYAVLNAAIFLIAWIKPWRALNLVGFVFTFGVGAAWGALKYRPELIASTEPFLLLFFALYLLIPVLHARLQARQQGGAGPNRAQAVVSGSLVFGTPLVVFALQAALLEGARMPLAFSALGAAAIYAALAALELRRWHAQLLGESHALLALGFATIAVPLALSAQATTCTFALEGAALVWLGLRQARCVPRWIGYALQGMAGAICGDGFAAAADAAPILNGTFLGAVLLALAGLVSARLLHRRDAHAPLTLLFLVWGGFWWYLAGGNEIERFAAHARHWDAWLAFLAATALIATEAARRLTWRELLVPAAVTIALGLPFVVLTMLDEHGPLEGWHLAAWAMWFAATWRTLPAIVADNTRVARILHFIYLWICTLLLSLELGHLGHDHLHLRGIWFALSLLAPFAAAYLLVLRRSPLAHWPLAVGLVALRTPLLGSLVATMGIAWLAGLVQEGEPTPLPYLPVLNPLELAQIAWLVLLALWYRQAQGEGKVFLDAELRARVLAAAGFVLLTSITLRCVHFFGGVPWDANMASSPLAQSALSIVWTLAGIAAMLAGKQRGSRAVWFGGAALMALVLVKLMLIDRNYLNDLSAIVGVLVVGVLLVAVGYFAPVPPKTGAAGEPT
ncbi:MAG: DUF2339 domain-containing protein [Proteobacteria bacterium]|nr:DUF2339 domain-containing protein [Pseudomonadota bacterium]